MTSEVVSRHLAGHAAPATLVEATLVRAELPLVTPFRTSFGTEEVRDVLLIEVALQRGDGSISRGWGECVALSEPLYSEEFVDAAELVIEAHLLWRLRAAFALRAADVAGLLRAVRGHQMAKAALEMAVLDAELRAEGIGLAEAFDVTRTEIPVGVSVGLYDDLDSLLESVAGYVEEGYERIKLKIEPGWDLEPVARVRELIGDGVGLQVDANCSYGRDDIEHLCRLDAFDLLLIEQPLAPEDLIGHARLADAARTPICLDESVVSAATAIDAIELGAAEVINIKAGRVGGYLEARRIHDVCLERGVPVWCGGMLETGIGRSANAVLAGLPGFTLPGDISAASRFYQRDIVRDPIVLEEGNVAVPRGPGLGYSLDEDALAAVTRRARTISMRDQ